MNIYFSKIIFLVLKKIALIRSSFYEVIKQQSQPLGLGYLAAILRENGYWVRIYDLNQLNINNFDFLHYLKAKKFDYIGVSALTYDFLGMIELCNFIKDEAELSHVPLIIGGVHVSSIPEFALKKTLADFVVIGEGEITIVELLKQLDVNRDLKNLQNINGIAYIGENQEFIRTVQRELIENLDDIPFPAWDLLHPELYELPHGVFYKRKPIFPIFTTRGCPYQCIYCASKNFWHQKIRFRSVEKVVDEIEFLITNYGAKEIQIWDDNFTLKRSYVMDFANELTKRKIKVLFSCPNGVRIDTLDSELLKTLYNIGFYSLIFAIESGSPKILTNIKKNLDLSIVSPIISEAKRLGFFTRGFFILGLPTENINDVYETMKFSLKLKLDSANFFIFTPIAGSSFFYKWIENKKLDDISWNFDFFSNPQSMAGFNKITQKEVFKLQRFLYIRFYLLRPWKIINYLSKFKIDQYKAILNRVLYLFKK